MPFKLLDKGALEIFGPYALSNGLHFCSVRVSIIASGYIYHYAFFIILGVSCLLSLNFFLIDTVNFEFFFMQFAFFALFFTNFQFSSYNR